MTHTTDLTELQQLREQFNLIDEKLEKQRIINEEILNASMQQKLSYIERWYQAKFRLIYTVPIICIIFLVQFIDMGFKYWGLSLLTALIGVLECFLYHKAYRALNIKNLPSLSMTDATENIARHKHLITMANRILVLPLIILIVWTILIGSRFTWNLPIIAITVFALGIGIALGITQQRANKKRLDEVLNQIKTLRG